MGQKRTRGPQIRMSASPKSVEPQLPGQFLAHRLKPEHPAVDGVPPLAAVPAWPGLGAEPRMPFLPGQQRRPLAGPQLDRGHVVAARVPARPGRGCPRERPRVEHLDGMPVRHDARVLLPFSRSHPIIVAQYSFERYRESAGGPRDPGRDRGQGPAWTFGPCQRPSAWRTMRRPAAGTTRSRHRGAERDYGTSGDPVGHRPRQPIELTEGECWRLLRAAPIGRVVFTRRAMPAIRPVNHIVDGRTIIIRTRLGAAVTSRVRDGQPSKACRPATAGRGLGRLLRGGRAGPGPAHGWSVIVTGLARLVTDPADIARYSAAVQP